jgi:hypothetical protein
MGQAAADAAANTRSQLIGLGISATVGVTPMIGQNNTPGEIFYLDDADQLVSFAKANPYVSWLSFWSAGRDNGSCAGQTAARADCSGLLQALYDFTARFRSFP